MISLRQGTLTVFAAFFFAFPWATPSWAITGSEIIEMCTGYPDSRSPRTCEFYVRSMIEFSTSGDKTVSPKGRLCIGKDVPITEVVAVINAWLAAHPELHASQGYDATFGGLAQHYRCK